jgi:hypothetical protein
VGAPKNAAGIGNRGLYGQSMSWNESFASRYEEWSAHMTADIAFCVGLALATDGPLVELAIGNGRVAIPVAQATGRRVIGIDSSPAMLAQARVRAAEAGVDLDLREGDMRDLALDKPAALIYCPFRALLHLAPGPTCYQARASKWIGPSKGPSVAMSTTTCPLVGGFRSVHPALSGPRPPEQNAVRPSARRSTTRRNVPKTTTSILLAGTLPTTRSSTFVWYQPRSPSSFRATSSPCSMVNAGGSVLAIAPDCPIRCTPSGRYGGVAVSVF